MGSKVVKQRQGRRSHKNVPAKTTPERNDVEYSQETAVCIRCEERIHVRDIVGPYLNRTCPCCNGVLREDDYDSAASDALAALRDARSSFQKFGDSSKVLRDKVLKRNHWWQYLYRVLAGRKLQELDRRVDEEERRISALTTKVSELSYGRYYFGEWFLLTHAPLSEGESPSAYKLQPRYELVGGRAHFYLKQMKRNDESRGLVGEFEAFEFFRKQVLDPSSVLKGAQLLPNLYVPNADRDIDSGGSPWSQVDLVIATKSCAFVVETKRKYAIVVAKEPYEEVLSGAPDRDGTINMCPWNAGLSQNSQHAADFSIACEAYPFERIFELLLLVGTRSFSPGGTRFIKNVYVGGLPDGRDQLLEAMGDACAGSTELLSDDDLESLAAGLLNRYGDCRQTRHDLHVKLIASGHAGLKGGGVRTMAHGVS